ncbi:MAG TPA: pyrimidine utilization protein D [Burkholderiales bacterium]|nr:pyrimidine utilization protein D [Burkholderiales bacterium]
MPKANDIHYEEHGTGKPLFLVSGLGGAAAYWKPNLPAFSAGYRVVVHDHRGAGQSAHSQVRYSVEQMTDDLVRLMDHLKIERAHVVGHSTGGAIGQVLALTRPERLGKLVLFATWTKADMFFRQLFAARRALLTEVGAEAYVRAGTLFLYPPWWIKANEKMLEEREKLALAAFPPPEIVASRIDAIVAFDRSTQLSRIKAPTLVLCAKDDAITPAYFSEELAQKIPGAKLVLLPEGGHCASETALETFNRALLDFLD